MGGPSADPGEQRGPRNDVKTLQEPDANSEYLLL